MVDLMASNSFRLLDAPADVDVDVDVVAFVPDDDASVSNAFISSFGVFS